MKNKSYIPFLAVFGAIMLVVMAAIAPSQFGRDFVHAQTTIDDATLSVLNLNAGGVGLDPAFVSTSDTRTYSARAPSETDKVTVLATAANSGADVDITPADQDSGSTGHQVVLTGGQNKAITVTVVSEDGTVTEIYTVTVYQVRTQPSPDDKLSALDLSDVRLSPAFGSDKEMYMGRAAYSTEDTTVTPTADIGAMIEITPADDDLAASGRQVNLDAGAVKVINVAVTAEDGGTPAKTYTVNVYRENLVKSDNADLNIAANNGLTLNSGTITAPSNLQFAYEPGMKSYPDVRVMTGVRAVIVAASTAQPGAVAVITPSDEDSETDGHQVLLSAGAKTDITVKVTAEDRTTTETYSVTIYRERRVESDDADLSALSLSGVTLSPAFASDKEMYMGRAPYSTDKPTVSYTADIGAMVTIEDDGGTDILDTDDASGHQVTLGVGVVTEINVVVVPEAGAPAEKTYTVNVYRENLVKSDNPDLDTAANNGLTLNSGTITAPSNLQFAYEPGMKSYPDVRVDNDVDAVIVAANTVHLGAVAVITPSDQDSLIDGHQVLLSAGAKTDITVKVTAEDGTTTDTYNVTIYRERRVESDDADLSALSLSGVTLSPAFDSDKTMYMGRAPYSTDKPTVSYTADVGAMMVAIEGVNAQGQANGTNIPDVDDASGHQVALGEGVVTPIAVVVTAEDGTAEKAYIVRVYRENLPPSDNASLAAEDADPPGLTLHDGNANLNVGENFTYLPATKSYPNVRVENEVQTITVAPTTAQMGAMAVITPSDQDSLSSGHQVVLGAGAKTDITIEVTAEDGITTDTYSVTIYRERRVESDDADLSALSLSGVVLTPPFASDKTDYIGSAANSTQMTTVSYTADIGAQMVEISAVVGGGTAVDADADNDLSNGYQVRLTRGRATVITIMVTAESDDPNAGADDRDMETYTIRVYRDAALSSDATLQSLALSGITLSPAFNPATTAYTAEAEDIETTTVEAMAAHPGATVEGTGMRTLTVGENVISVTVTAEDETTQTYTVTVTVTAERSSVATLQALALSGITLSPAFDSATTEYAAEVEYTVETTTVVAMPTHPGATVEGDGPQSLAEGDNTFIVTVTAEDGTSQETYTVTVIVGEAPPVEGDLLGRYDADDSGDIDKSEAIAAINDYLFGEGDQQITKAQAIEVINLYLFP